MTVLLVECNELEKGTEEVEADHAGGRDRDREPWGAARIGTSEALRKMRDVGRTEVAASETAERGVPALVESHEHDVSNIFDESSAAPGRWSYCDDPVATETVRRMDPSRSPSSRSPSTPSRRTFLWATGSLAAVSFVSGLPTGARSASATSMGADSRSDGWARRPEELDALTATAWFDLTSDLVRETPGYSPPVAARAFAYLGIAVYESLVAGSHTHRSLHQVIDGLPDVAGHARALPWPLAANAAAARTVRSLFPSVDASGAARIDELERELGRRGAADAPRLLRDRAVRHGEAVAGAIVEWARTDGGHDGHTRNFPTDYTPPAGPGLWVPTPPGFVRSLLPTWGTNRPFVVAPHDGPARPPTTYSSDVGSSFHREAIEVHDAVAGATPDQQAIAIFWSDDPGVTSTPAGHSISVATQLISLHDVSLMAAVETYARVGMAISDAFVCCWATKYRHHLLRPVSYLREHVDPSWTPMLVTPPFPEHTSGHSVQSAAAFGVLEQVFGGDVAFVDHTHARRGLPPRAFASLRDAAAEAALSRLYGGIHFRPAIEDGLQQGRVIADRIGRLAMRRDLPNRTIN